MKNPIFSIIKYPIQDPDDEITHRTDDDIDVVWGRISRMRLVLGLQKILIFVV